MAYNRIDNDFSGLNNIPISDDIIDQFSGSTDPIDLENVHEDTDTQTTISSNTKRKDTKQKAKCWQYFELMPTGKLVNGVPEFKAQCKHYQEKFTWQKGIRHDLSKQTLQKVSIQTWMFGYKSGTTPVWISREPGPVLLLSTTEYIHKNSCATKDCRN
ncbi:hypothetical protein Adt_13441 [Abeliophyllum distichum]|uniref:Uncharacterized protein n=1 Tax=Abeliophyllum distichum TaxID=126358 RepID=A0ABD1TWT0_9LAMI